MNKIISGVFFFAVIFAAGFAQLFAVIPDEELPVIRAWRLHDLYTEKQSTEIDTSINSFHVHNPLFRQSISYSFLGNPGLAAMSNTFSERGLYSDFFFIDPFLFYLLPSTETKYYNTRRPFSLIDFSTGGPRGKNEKMLDILHTQNVNPDFNLGFRYFNINSDGQYQNQEAITNAISLFSSYVLDNYQFHASFNLNSARVFENGGLVDDASLYNEDFETEDHQVRLQDARNGLRNNSFFLSHSWQPFFYSSGDTLPETGSSWIRGLELYHVFRYDQYRRTYQDNNPMSGFYPEILIDNTTTFDSVYYRSLNNKLMVQLPEFNRGSVSFNAKGGIKNELLKGSYNILSDTVYKYSDRESLSDPAGQPSDTVIRNRNEHKFSSNALVAVARGNIGEVFGIWGEGSYFFNGHRTGEYDLQAGIIFDLFEGKNQSVFEAGIKQKELTPSIFLNSFFSNHFSWNNEFSRIGESTLKGSVKMPGRKLAASADLTLLNNYIYFDGDAIPRQYTDIFPVINVSLKKDFNLWRFYFSSVINYQLTDKQDILPLPELSAYQSTWYEQKLISDIMTVQVGFDVYYAAEHRGYAYQPATAQFYLQNERTFGNYPFIDVFINIKHKRARIFLKGEHMNSGFLEPEYFSVLNYPRNERMFKFGFSWSFYN